MRLIDADLFMENVRKELNCDERCCECVHDNVCEIYKMTLNQPTAYDVDKVVKRLESILEGVNIQLELSKDFQPKESKSVKSDIVFFAEKKRLCEEFIKIVKSGGIV